MTITYGGASRPPPLEPAALPLPPAAPWSPVIMLSARFGVVPFIDFAGLLADLVTWSESSERFSLRILAGPGGVGKTRTAVRLCQELSGRNWLTGMLAPGADGAAHSLAALQSAPMARLVVVDCADTHPERVSALVSSMAEQASHGYPVRVLLTVGGPAVAGDWLASLWGSSKLLDAWLRLARLDVLTDRPLDAATRRQLFAGAYGAFAKLLSRPTPPAETPAELAATLFSNPLMTVIAAYLAVQGERPPVTASELVERLVGDHEDRYWQQLATVNQVAPLENDKSLRRQVVALAGLAGAHDESEAVRMLGLIVETSSMGNQQLARWARQLYGGSRYWSRMEPDLVAQHLVSSTFGQEEAVLAGVLSERRPAELAHPVGLLARTGEAHAGFASTVAVVLDQQLKYLCDQVVAQTAGDPARTGVASASNLGSALTDLVQVCPPDPAALPAILDALPPHSDFALRHLSLVLTQQTEAYFRRLSQVDPADSLPNLAIALNNLSVRFADMGRYNHAASAVREATGYFRNLAETEPGPYMADLATSLHNLSLWLTDIGQRDQAAAAIGEAVGQYRALSSDDAALYLPRLASSLRDLSLRLAAMGRHEQARAAATEAVTHYRRLAASNAAYVGDLAASLQNLSLRLADIGLQKEAAAKRTEAQSLLQPPSSSRRPGRR